MKTQLKNLRIHHITIILVSAIVLLACLKQEPQQNASSIIEDSTVAAFASTSGDTTIPSREIFLKLLTIPQDSLLEIVYGEEAFGEVIKIDRSIGVYASDSGKCLAGAVAIIKRRRETGDEAIDLA